MRNLLSIERNSGLAAVALAALGLSTGSGKANELSFKCVYSLENRSQCGRDATCRPISGTVAYEFNSATSDPINEVEVDDTFDAAFVEFYRQDVVESRSKMVVGWPATGFWTRFEVSDADSGEPTTYLLKYSCEAHAK